MLKLNGEDAKACVFCHALHPLTEEFWDITKKQVRCHKAKKHTLQKSRQKHYARQIVNASKQHDKEYNRYDPVDYIDQAWILTMQNVQQDLCFYCKSKMKYGISVNRQSPAGLTAERLDNTRGHQKDNCVLAHKGCQYINQL